MKEGVDNLRAGQLQLSERIENSDCTDVLDLLGRGRKSLWMRIVILRERTEEGLGRVAADVLGPGGEKWWIVMCYEEGKEGFDSTGRDRA